MLRGVLFLVLLVAPAANGADLVVTEAWIREAPPGAQTLAGYAVLSNRGNTPVQVSGAHATDFGAVQLHEMTMTDGVMRMRELPSIEIAAGASVKLEPGASHLMLLRPTRALRAGDMVQIEFGVEGRGAATGEFTVRKAD